MFGNTWGYDTNDTNKRRFSSFTKNDCHRLQVLQNKVLRLKTGLSKDTPTKTLLEKSNDMSVHQIITYHTLLSTFKILKSNKPTYLFDIFNIG